MKTRLISKIGIFPAFVAALLIAFPMATQAFPAGHWLWVRNNLLNWSGSLGPGEICPTSGTNCSEVHLVYLWFGTLGPDSTTWNVYGQCDTITAAITGEVGVDSISVSPLNFTFPPGTLMQIDSGWFPGVPEQTFDMSGITTDDTGGFTASNPVY
jgi:hypothetical protein